MNGSTEAFGEAPTSMRSYSEITCAPNSSSPAATSRTPSAGFERWPAIPRSPRCVRTWRPAELAKELAAHGVLAEDQAGDGNDDDSNGASENTLH